MIEILYFAGVREALDVDREAVPIGNISSVSALIDHLCGSREETWQTVLGQPNLLVAVNQIMVKKDQPLKDGDEVAFFPPVSGG